MNIYAFIYAFSIISSIIGWILVFKRLSNLSGFFFLLFTILLSAWFFLYFLFFSSFVDDASILLPISRLSFAISTLGFVSLMLFVKFFQQSREKVFTKKLLFVLIGYLGVAAIYVFTPWIIESLYLDEHFVYREVYGPFFFVYIAISLSFLPILISYSIQQLKKQTLLNRIRLKNILASISLLFFFGIILQLILPLFGIWLFEKELVFLLMFFVISVVYTIKRYYFSSLGYHIGRSATFLGAILLTFLSIYLIKNAYAILESNPGSYWLTNDDSFARIAESIILFLWFHRILQRIFLGGSAQVELKSAIQKLQKQISYLTSIKAVEACLKKEMHRIFRTSFCEIRLFGETRKHPEIQQYFESAVANKIFINDVVFIEENKAKFNKSAILREIPKEAFLVLPMFGNDGASVIGVLILGAKLLGDFYTADEITSLQDFVFFLELHTKYIRTYEQIQDLSINLDRKVDEKTIEFNNLINRQKEFISVISHEIKAPVANAIFQTDSIMDDLEQNNTSQETMKKEVELLSSQLLKTGELINRLFSMQYFDTHDVTLFKEKVQIPYLLETECEVYSRVNEGVHFIRRIDEGIGFIGVDRIQFQQVISNLLQNAVKFANGSEPTIIITAKKKDDQLHISIEDNGNGFHGIDTHELFEQYSTGGGGTVGLGMGLYLCKRIITMHGGTITANTSKELGWAKIHITIPV